MGAADFDLELIESRTSDGRTQELIYRATLHNEPGADACNERTSDDRFEDNRRLSTVPIRGCPHEQGVAVRELLVDFITSLDGYASGVSHQLHVTRVARSGD
jgi:hypothetical protein